jgi:hypothetical protein
MLYSTYESRVRNEKAITPLNRWTRVRSQLILIHTANMTTSILALVLHKAQAAKAIAIGPLNMMRLNPPCHPYSENTGSESNLGAKVTSTIYVAILSITVDVRARRLTSICLLIPNLWVMR